MTRRIETRSGRRTPAEGRPWVIEDGRIYVSQARFVRVQELVLQDRDRPDLTEHERTVRVLEALGMTRGEAVMTITINSMAGLRVVVDHQLS